MCRPGDLAGGHVSFGDSKSYSWNTRSADPFLKFVRDAALAVETQLTEIPHVALLEVLDI